MRHNRKINKLFSVAGLPVSAQTLSFFASIMPTAKAKLAPYDKPPVSLGGEQWINSEAKHLMIQDMLDGLVPCDQKIKNVFKLWKDFYAHQPQFKNFPYEESRFRSRLEALQKSVKRLTWAARYDHACLLEAKAIFPDETHGPTGEILWRESEADKLLDSDMSEEKHLEMAPSELRDTRPEYKFFTPKRFAKRIDQKREAAKPYGANPMQVAAKKAARDRKKVRNRPELSRRFIEGAAEYDNTD